MPLLFGWENTLGSNDPSVVLWTVILYSVFLGFGTQVLLYSNAMEQISPSVLEAAQLDGVGNMGELFFIVLPDIMGTISTFMIATIAGAFINQANLYTFYGEWIATNMPDANTLGSYMFVIVFNSRIDRVVYGCKDVVAGCCGSVINFNAYPFNHSFTIESGVCETQATELLKGFFEDKRKEE